jgi:CDP-diacylglycerol--serine O-phosphatidyltransferase
MLAIVLVSYSPPEVLFFVMTTYALSGYVLWLRDRFKKKMP